ncbi:hypothetical protein TBLA_0A05630 [Henningerozyma blattae CBS 6284]|uniref:Uncharacterized protein n=1 Tax=Henningerozyma blattae (strain ATCC 34711 / CBS 6284 / DSM 70876 / NBRC 10599 / NRRL Y-10934 / UCD 77-7) TaxID=1071380 RepID=I2GW54_HENB6|nr:hypothetical protein TBLA_0A05630 [Tetrapisispora blattae CBS 6284]CCH58356.1 hypothetical protein TBLA_0A05630 [Tetrapisispora blattae CBS 6284]
MSQRQSAGLKDIKQLKLISVAFKEASLDSPSFRASVNYFQTKVEAFESWIERTVNFVDNQFADSYDEFRRTKEALINQLLPSPVMLSNGFVSNQGFTPLLVDNFNKDYRQFVEKLLCMLLGDGSSYSASLLELMTGAIEPYKQKRMNFDYYQTKYDTLVGRFHSVVPTSNITIDPKSLYEDATQLFEVRKSYLQASLDLVAAMSVMELSMDKFLIEIIGVLKSKNKFDVAENGTIIDLTPQIDSYLVDHQKWVKKAIESARTLESDMERAKARIIEYSVKKMAPSNDIKDYNTKEIDPKKLIKRVPKQYAHPPEKAGWLYMKTNVGRPSREIWVRRWCFVQNSVFGMFLLSPSKTYVEETGKFGVSLISVRYLQFDDRCFTFEVKIEASKATNDSRNNKTEDISIILQAEDLHELTSWLSIFSHSKAYLSTLNKNSFEFKTSSRVFAPEFSEFASSTITSVDQILSVPDSETKQLLSYLKSGLLEKDDIDIDDEKITKLHMAVTPLTTKMTQPAVLSHLYVKNTWLPSAVVANIWGTTNWNDYSLIEDYQKTPDNVLSKEITTYKNPTALHYPSYYSPNLKLEDIQFKSIFFSIDQVLLTLPNELLLLKFTGFWRPNRKQEFSATYYVTNEHIFGYLNFMGFVSLTKMKLSDIVSIEIDKTSQNTLKIYDVTGSHLSIDVYFSDIRVTAASLQFLLENKAAKEPKKEEDLLEKLKQIEIQFKEKTKKEILKRNQTLVTANTNEIIEAENLPLSHNTFWRISDNGAKLLARRKRFQMKYSVTYTADYDIASKALTHVLFGDQSDAFPFCFLLAQKDSKYNMNWYWKEEKSEDGAIQMVRRVHFQINLIDNFLENNKRGRTTESSEAVVIQRMTKVVENRYYEIDQDPSLIKFPFCRPLQVKVKYIITEPYDPEHEVASKLRMATNRSQLHILYRFQYVHFKSGKPVKFVTPWEKFMKNLVLKYSVNEFILFKKVIKYYLERIGKHGKILKAIKMCGMLGVSNNSILEGSKEESEENSKDKDDGKNRSKNRSKKYDIQYSIYTFMIIMMELTLYRFVNLILILVRLMVNFFSLLGKGIANINITLVVGLLVSILVNMFLSGKSSVSYWSVKRAEKIFEDHLSGKDMHIMQRAISIDEIDLLTKEVALEDNNLAFEKFKQRDSDKDYQYRDTRQELAIRRNELLVELKILQNMERELVHGDYRKFLLQEIDKCNVISQEMTGLWLNDTKLQKYCINCNDELDRLSSLLL